MNLPVIQQQGELKQAVNARELHSYLEVGRDFSTWIKERIFKYDFIENVDFIRVTKSGDGINTGFQPIDYFISIDMAKELSMVENNEQGKTARKHFIKCEKELKEKVPVLTQAQMLHQMTAMLVEQERKTLALENDVKEIKATQSAIIENTHHFATMGFARNHGIKLDTMLCAKLSRKCTSLSKTLGVVMGKAPDTRFGTVNTYHKDILKEVFTQEGLI